MALISFLASDGININDLAGSGLGFYGAGNFGTSVRVGDYQDNTYVSDATGALQGAKTNNIKYVHPFSGQLPTSDVHVLQEIPNYLATLNVRFTHPTPVKITNAVVRIFDRANIDTPAVGVSCKVAEAIHPWTNMSPLGSGDTQWSNLGGSGGTIGGVVYDPPLALADSPGSGGWSPDGPNTLDTQHDHFLLISASPDTNGSKVQFGLYYACEYI